MINQSLSDGRSVSYGQTARSQLGNTKECNFFIEIIVLNMANCLKGRSEKEFYFQNRLIVLFC